MKILAFTDIHSDEKIVGIIKKKCKKYDPELLICSGDLTYFELNLKLILNLLNSFKKKVILIHGNHEEGGRLKKLCKNYSNLIYLHKNKCDIGDYRFLGYGGLGFSRITKDLENFILKNKSKNKKNVLIFHQPPFGTKLDKISEVGHVGNKSITKIIKSIKPILSVSGHIHETFKITDKIGKTILINPGPEGKIISI